MASIIAGDLAKQVRAGDQAATARAAQLLAEAYGIPWWIFRNLLMAESGMSHWDDRGRVKQSSAGALGIGQLMPSTAKSLGVNPNDPVENLEGAARYLRQMFARYGRWDAAVAAYNAGPGAVDRAFAGGQLRLDALPSETRVYLERVLGGSGEAQAAVPQDASTVAGLSTEDLAQLQAEQLEAMADMLRRLGFSEEEIRLFLRSQVGLPATSAQDMLKTGISWLDALSQTRREALGQAYQAQSGATKLLVTLLGRAVPEGGTIPGLEPGGSVDYFSRLAGLSPMPQPQTRQVDLGPLFSLARQMRPEEDLYFSALAQTAARLGMGLPTLWERALQEAGAIEDENTRQEVTTALQDWRQRVIQNAATPEEAFAALGWAM